MRHPLLYMVLTAVLTLVMSCKPNDPVDRDLLELSGTSIHLTQKAQTTSMEIVSTDQFHLTPSTESWCSSSFTKIEVAGYRIRYRIYISVRENTDTEARQTYLVLTCGAKSEKLYIQQDGQPTVPEPQPEEPKNAVEFAMTMAPGWNLGNNLDAAINGVSNETCWGNGTCTQQTMTRVKEAGFRSVRIPVSWIGHIGAAPNYTIETKWMNRVKEVVGYAHNAGLKVIINIHHDGNPDVAGKNYWLDMQKAMSDDAYNTQVKTQLAAVWTQIANRFKNEGDYLIFEDLNEISDGNPFSGSKVQQMQILNQWNQVFVDAVRATGGNNATRYLGVASFYARCDLATQSLTIPTDVVADRIMVSVHSYDPWDFAGTGKDASWGHTGTIYRNGEQECVDRMKSLYDRFVSRGIPVYVGECGAINRANSKETEFQRYYMEYYAKAGASYYIPFFLWDNGTNNKTGEEAFGYLNHATGAYINNSKPLIDALVKAQTDKSVTYTLESIYNKAPK